MQKRVIWSVSFDNAYTGERLAEMIFQELLRFELPDKIMLLL